MDLLVAPTAEFWHSGSILINSFHDMKQTLEHDGALVDRWTIEI